MKTNFLFVVSILLGASITYAQENEIPEAGNVGLGTTTPTAKLDVRGDVKVQDSLVVQSTARIEDLIIEGNAIFKQDATINGILYLPNLSTIPNFDNQSILLQKSDGSILKAGLSAVSEMSYSKECATVNGNVPNPTWHNGVNKIYVDCPTVNVGIGTNTPLHRLDVRGVGSFSNSVLVGNVLTTNYPNQSLFEGLKLESTSGPLMRLAVRKTDGTTEVRFKVEKTGEVYATAVRVRLSASIPIPDYAFKPEYKLMPIPELKAFVTTNNHLPNIPSENEIREEGLSLEEMQMKLLEKVEELTLYIIQLSEQSAAQEEENAKLKAELEALKTLLNLK